jgi:ribosomal protein L11 methyltransferase
MTKLYLSLSYSIPEERYEDAYTALSGVDMLGMTEAFDEISICLLHDGSPDFETTQQSLIEKRFERYNVPFARSHSALIPEENWNKAWEDSIEPIRASERIVITPSWKADEVRAELKLIINPQMSFGSGHHETTKMMIQLLEETVQPNQRWVDAGTGTGILAIAALKLGASFVYAFDNDEWSAKNAAENCALNGVSLPSETIVVEQQNLENARLPKCSGIAANLHKNLLLPAMPQFADALMEGGTLLVSGLLKYDETTVIEYANKYKFNHIKTLRDGEWIAIKFQYK